MIKLLFAGSAAQAHTHIHPISEDMVNSIKAKNTTWIPMEVSENPLSDLSIEEL